MIENEKREKRRKSVRDLARKVYGSEESEIELPRHTRIIINVIETPVVAGLVLAYLAAIGYGTYNAASKIPDLAAQAYNAASDIYQQVNSYVEPFVEQFLS